MKNLYPKNKGKVYPSPSAAAGGTVAVNPSSSSSSSLPPGPNRDVFSVLNLLPTAIIALVSILSLQDQEVLAYLITRSMKTTNPFSILDEEKKQQQKKKRCNNNNKKSNNNNHSTTTTTSHKPPIFDCGCFDCYTSYWFRWDSSPNRELIHQAIEAFEEHLTNGELCTSSSTSSSSSKKKNGKGGKKKDKTPTTTTGRRGNTKTEEESEEKKKSSFVLVLLPTQTEAPKEQNKADDFPVGASDFKSDDMGNEEQVQQQLDEVVSGELKQTVEEEEEEAVQLPASINRGLVRKVLPDVLGLFNSRLWSLWNPTV